MAGSSLQQIIDELRAKVADIRRSGHNKYIVVMLDDAEELIAAYDKENPCSAEPS